MDIESIYMTLYGASKSNGAKYEVILKWFTECKIIDEKSIDVNMFTKAYERINPNKEDMNLVHFAQLIGILARESKQDIQTLSVKFKKVNQTIIDEIKESYSDDEYI